MSGYEYSEFLGKLTFLVNIHWCKLNFLSTTLFRFSWYAKKICRLSRCICRLELCISSIGSYIASYRIRSIFMLILFIRFHEEKEKQLKTHGEKGLQLWNGQFHHHQHFILLKSYLKFEEKKHKN